MRLLEALGDLGPLGQVARNTTLARRVDACLVTRRDIVEVESELGGSTGNGLGVDGQTFPVDVVEIIARGMVTRVLGGTGAGEDAG